MDLTTTAPPCYSDHPDCADCDGSGYAKRKPGPECPACQGYGAVLCAACRAHTSGVLAELRRQEAWTQAERAAWWQRGLAGLTRR